MPVNVLAFGKIADITRQQKLEISAGDLAELREKLNMQFPALTEQKFSIAVNKQLCNANMPLADGDEIALLPPFSGG
jgi:molybdopterin synthase sulfur carrier subunit